MGLRELLGTLEKVASQHKIHQPWICGGVVRDIAFAREGHKDEAVDELRDLDITTGYEDVRLLADLFAAEIGSSAKEFKDGHKQVVAEGLRFDFSTNFKYDHIDKLLKKAGIENPDDLVRETFSRDFTINALLMPLDFSKIVDLTGKGLEDVRNKVLRCPLDCDVSFRQSPNRLMRAFVYSTKFGLKMTEGLRDSIRGNLELFGRLNPRYAGEKLNEALRYDPELLDELIELGVLPKLPLTKHLTRLLIGKRRLLDVLK